MDYAALAKERTKYLCDNLHEGHNVLIVSVDIMDEELWPLVYDTIGETFYIEMARLRPDVANVKFSGKMVDSVLNIKMEATI
jgi:hypothetical protein